MRVVLTGGGTGGHLMPLAPVVETLRTIALERKENVDIRFFGVVDNTARELFKSYDVKTIDIPSGKIRRYVSYLTFFDLLFRLPFGIIKALFLLWALMPDVVISKGGYGSIPVALAAQFYRIPILVHESDSVPGLANKMLARLAKVIAVGFPETKKHLPAKYGDKTVVTGIPIRNIFRQNISQAEAKKKLKIPESEKLIVVMGGSQGAKQINEAFLRILPQVIASAAIIHIAGEKQFQAVAHVAKDLLSQSSRKSMYQVYPILQNEIHLAFFAADVIISRSGATTLAELAAAKKPALLVPLPNSAQNNQQLNAHVFEQAGAARVLDDINLGAGLLQRNLNDLLTNEELRSSIAQNLAAFDNPNSARQIATLAFDLTT